MAAAALEKPRTEAAAQGTAKAEAAQELWSGGDLFMLMAWAAIVGYIALVFLAVLCGGIFASLVTAAR